MEHRTQPSAGPIADHGSANSLGDGKCYSRRSRIRPMRYAQRATVGFGAHGTEMIKGGLARQGCDQLCLLLLSTEATDSALADFAIDCGYLCEQVWITKVSGNQPRSSPATASPYYPSAASSPHSCTISMFFRSFSDVRLKCTFHNAITLLMTSRSYELLRASGSVCSAASMA